MERSYLDKGVQKIFYERQVRCVEELIKPGSVILDVGCGAQMRYTKLSEALFVGLDPSFPSVARNMADVRLCSSAERMPIQNESIDLIVCFYSLHHMVGVDHEMSRRRVLRTFTEFGRILRPRGKILAFEVTLPRPFYLLEQAAWQSLRTVLGSKMDMHFYSIRALQDIALQALGGAKLKLTVTRYRSSPFVVFPPVLALPGFKIPRFLSPLSPTGFQWEKL